MGGLVGVPKGTTAHSQQSWHFWDVCLSGVSQWSLNRANFPPNMTNSVITPDGDNPRINKFWLTPNVTSLRFILKSSSKYILKYDLRNSQICLIWVWDLSAPNFGASLTALDVCPSPVSRFSLGYKHLPKQRAASVTRSVAFTRRIARDFRHNDIPAQPAHIVQGREIIHSSKPRVMLSDLYIPIRQVSTSTQNNYFGNVFFSCFKPYSRTSFCRTFD